MENVKKKLEEKHIELQQLGEDGASLLKNLQDVKNTLG